MRNITKEVVMTKKGIGTVILRQGAYSDRQKWYTITANNIETSIRGADAMNRTYKSYLANGWVVKTPTEQRFDAPKPPKAEKFIWCKETRKIWAEEFDRRKKEALKDIQSLRGKEYHEARIQLEKRIKEDMKIWEAENASKVNAEILQRRAEADAIQQ